MGLDQSNFTFSQSVFDSNSARSQGGAVFMANSTGTSTNLKGPKGAACIIWIKLQAFEIYHLQECNRLFVRVKTHDSAET